MARGAPPHGSAPGRAARPPTPRGTPGGEPGAEISLEASCRGQDEKRLRTSVLDLGECRREHDRATARALSRSGSDALPRLWTPAAGAADRSRSATATVSAATRRMGEPPSGRTSRVGLASGSARSRRPECGPRVQALRVCPDYPPEGKEVQANCGAPAHQHSSDRLDGGKQRLTIGRASAPLAVFRTTWDKAPTPNRRGRCGRRLALGPSPSTVACPWASCAVVEPQGWPGSRHRRSGVPTRGGSTARSSATQPPEAPGRARNLEVPGSPRVAGHPTGSRARSSR